MDEALEKVLGRWKKDLCSEAPHTKLPTYEGQEDIDVFLVPFEKLAERYAWSEMQKIDHLYESL